MNSLHRLAALAAASAGALCVAPASAADETVPAAVPTALAAPFSNAAAAAAPTSAAPAAHPALGSPLDARRLSAKRGGTGVLSDMQLRGVVSDNRAVNVTTGSNAISDGAFSGMSGLPMVVQNTGNNVLIQNATIINVQVK